MLHTDKSITHAVQPEGLISGYMVKVYQGSAVWQTTHTTLVKFERRVF